MPGVHGMIGGNGGAGMEMEQQPHEHDMSQQQQQQQQPQHHGTPAIPTQHTNTLLQQEHLSQQGSTLFLFFHFFFTFYFNL
jgi:hypothetical protein